MPVLNCICGHRIEGADDAALRSGTRGLNRLLRDSGGPTAARGLPRAFSKSAVERFRGQDLAIAETYPPKHAPSDALAFRGTLEMYLAAGFALYREREQSVIVRKSLSAQDLT